MVALLASPAFGQTFKILESGSSVKVSLGASGIGGATFAVDSSPLYGYFHLNNPGGPTYDGPTTLLGTTVNSTHARNSTALAWSFAPFGIDLTTKRNEFEILGFNAPVGGGSDFFPGTTPGALAGGPPASGTVLTEMLTHLIANGSAVGSPVTLDSTTWVPPLDVLSMPAPFTVTVGPDGSLGLPGGGPDEALVTNSFWIDFGDVQAEFMITMLGVMGRSHPSPPR
jgi:hypothetical protein